ncbi:MAG: thermonuclease family protein [Alphaproteobacteria bacterium]
MLRRPRFLWRLMALAFAASAPFALHVDDLFAGQPRLAALTAPGEGEPARAAAISGRAKAIEGDLLEVGGTRVRLFGIDAPEIEQTCRVMIFVWGCGQDAQKMLSALIAEHTVRCVEMARDPNGVPAALCETEAAQLNETMVRIGMALASPAEPRSFASEEAAAAREGIGVWRSKFDKPWEWRDASAAR